MREIKFRIWLENEEFMGEVVQLTMIKDNVVEIKAKDTINGGWYYVYEDSKFILMQYTGLKDINGVEIYEGDIVKWGHLRERSKEKPHRVASVVMNPGIQFNSQVGTFKLGAFAYQDTTEQDLQVIGNIYENPELLEVD